MIRFGREGDVGVIRLMRPEKRNALTPEALETLADPRSWLEGTDMEGASALLLCGEGSVFCAGFDLETCRGPAGAEPLRRLLRGLSGAVVALRSQARPVVAAAHGAAIAGGCALLGGADIVVADAGAKLGYPVVRLGISPAVSAPFLRGAIGDGPGRARLLDPGLIDGRRAAGIGLVHELVESPADVQGRAMAIAAELAAKGASAIGATRAWLDTLEAIDAAGGLAASEQLAGDEESQALLDAMWTARTRERS
ncbi:MAG: enoyl-CoA hydratase/isomerase family protein [Phycisphaerales bacterium JB039]